MKKAILYLLITCFAFFIAGCSDTTTQNQDQTNNGSLNSSEQTGETLGDFNKTATLTETVMYEENGVKITAKGLTYNNNSVDLGVFIENNSGKDLSVISGSLGYSRNSVNGYMIEDGYLNCNVANGKSANDTLSFSFDNLMLYGINEIADMEIDFDISDAEYNHTYSGPIQIKTSAYDSHDYSKDYYRDTISSSEAMNTYDYSMVHFATDSIYEEMGIKHLSSGLMKNKDGEYAALIEFENTTDKNVNLSVSDVLINDMLVYPSTWTVNSINAGKHCIVDIDISSIITPECQNAYGIDEIASISFSLSQSDENGNDIADSTPMEIVIPDAKAEFDTTGNEVYNNNGLTIVSKTILQDSSSVSPNVYVLLLAKNDSGKTLRIDDEFNSLSVNGTMTDYILNSMDVPNGKSAAMIIELQSYSLENNSISSVSDISDVELTLEIKDGSQTIDTPIISVQN